MHKDNLKDMKQAVRGLKGKCFINAKSADFIANFVESALDPAVLETAQKYNINMRNMIRFQIVAETCRLSREKKQLDYKQVAAMLKAPQYRIKDIECSRLKDVLPDILECYIDFLGLRVWFKSWIKHNADVYKRLQAGKCDSLRKNGQKN